MAEEENGSGSGEETGGRGREDETETGRKGGKKGKEEDGIGR